MSDSQTNSPTFNQRPADIDLIKDLAPFIEIKNIEPLTIRGQIREPINENIDLIKRYFNNLGFQPFFDKFDSEVSPHIISLVPSDVAKSRQKSPSIILNIVLFVATIFTTLLVSALNRGGNPFANFTDIFLGVPFSFSLMLILSGHELGHFFVSRHFQVKTSLPYFLPIPHPLIGTMGAFIKVESMLPNRKALIRIGASGPIIGFLLAIPITIIGIALSKVIPTDNFVGIKLGSSMLFNFLTQLIHREIPAGHDLVLHPMAFAGWLGFLVTALNLLPVGQLDGGHIAYAVFGKYRKYVTLFILIGIALLGIFWPGWFFWILLIVLFGLRHPKAQDEISKISTTDWIFAFSALVIFILSFIPVPFPIR
ncbi:MAG: site-2 protease family protein [candidate division WOR-3 bacterium]|nr:site-2 protease family protein [candidate division WOR-3 bacterium]